MTGAMDQLYQQLILDHAKAPHGRGLAADFDAESFQVNSTCGDEIRLRVHLRHGPDVERGPGASGPVIEAVTWEGLGCSISQASASVLTDLVAGRPVLAAEQLGDRFRELMHARGQGLDPQAEEQLGDATAFTGVARYPARIKCALLGWMALHDALLQSGALAPSDVVGTTQEEHS